MFEPRFFIFNLTGNENITRELREVSELREYRGHSLYSLLSLNSFKKRWASPSFVYLP